MANKHFLNNKKDSYSVTETTDNCLLIELKDDWGYSETLKFTKDEALKFSDLIVERCNNIK